MTSTEHRQRQRGTPTPTPAAGGPPIATTQQATPGSFDLNVYQGDSYKWQFTLWTDAAKTQPYDLSNSTVAAQIRDRPDGNLLATLTTAITNPNIILVTLISNISDELTASGVWDLQVTDQNGWVSTVVAGKVNVTQDVTDLTS